MTVAVLAASAPGYGIKCNGCSAQPSSLSMKTEKVIAPMSETRSHRPWRADHILSGTALLHGSGRRWNSPFPKR